MRIMSKSEYEEEFFSAPLGHYPRILYYDKKTKEYGHCFFNKSTQESELSENQIFLEIWGCYDHIATYAEAQNLRKQKMLKIKEEQNQ